jgi:heme exporter protein D
MGEVDLMFPFWVWLAVAIGTSVMSLVGTWVVIKKSRLLK